MSVACSKNTASLRIGVYDINNNKTKEEKFPAYQPLLFNCQTTPPV